MSEQSPQSLGRYTIHAEIGKGGFATVYRATDTMLEREVALKILKPGWTDDAKAVERFMREARQASRLKHPNIVTIYDVGQAQGRLFIAMELVRGRSLQQIIVEDGAMAWSRVLAILEQSAAALDYAHKQGLIHRDIKPANILLDESEPGATVHAILTDFGLVRGAEQASLSTGTTGGLLGTPEYIAPEIWNGEPATIASDIYALGCVAFYLLTGQVLFSATTPMAVLKRHVEGPVFPREWPSGVPSGVRAVLRRTLAKESNRRPGSGAEFVAQLRACEGPGMIEAGAAVQVARRAEEEGARQEAATRARPPAPERDQQPATIVTQPVVADKAGREAKEKAQRAAAGPIAAAGQVPSSTPKSRRWIWVLAGLIAAGALVVIGLIASGGRPSGPPGVPVTPTTAIAGLPPLPSQPSPTPTFTPTSSVTPPPTFTPTPTDTPTPTPIPTATGTGPNGCQLNGTFIADVTTPDNTVLAPNQQFVKTWRVRNDGNCQWDATYQLVFFSGDQMPGLTAVNIPAAGPGQTVDVSVNLAAPATMGNYRGNWGLRASNGVGFLALSVVIRVIATPTPTLTPQVVVCIPSLISPGAGAVLDNGRTDQLDNIVWDFNWSDCPGATAYQLYVIHSGATIPVINNDAISGSSYHHVSGGYVADSNRLNWTWKVRASINGQWGAWSETRTFDVEPVNTDSQAACTPSLVSPAAGKTLDNGRTDQLDNIVWDFNWSDCSGATVYQLYVIHSGATIPVINKNSISGSSYHHVSGGYIIDSNRLNWTWKVRASINGQWGPWSETRSFDVEPVNTDPPTR